jgi:hypothetical protein
MPWLISSTNEKGVRDSFIKLMRYMIVVSDRSYNSGVSTDPDRLSEQQRLTYTSGLPLMRQDLKLLLVTKLDQDLQSPIFIPWHPLQTYLSHDVHLCREEC